MAFKKGACEICGAAQKDQHSNREAGICDAKKNPVVRVNGENCFKVQRTKKGGTR